MASANQKQVLEFIKENNCIISKNTITPSTLWSVSKKDKSGNFRYQLWKIIIIADSDIVMDDIKNKTKKHKKVGYYTESGLEDGKITKSKITYITEGKNIGRNNETTPLTQTILNVRTQYNKKIREGRKKNKKDILTSQISFNNLLNDKSRGNTPWRVMPMALKDVNNKKVKTSYWKTYVKYPVYIQPKYDGIRMLSVFINKINDVDLYSRGLENIKQQDEIKKSLKFLSNNHGLYLDGELWGEGLSLQIISGIGRRVDKNTNIKLKYYVYDCFMIDKPNLTFPQRYEILQKIKKECDDNIVIVDSHICENKKEVINKYTEYLDLNYEGAVIRNSTSLYEFGIQKEIRSSQTLKIKPNNDEEYIVIGYKEGIKGKDVGALIWILQITEETVKRDLKYNPNIQYPVSSERNFDAVPKNEMGTYDNRYLAYKYLQDNPDYFKNNIYGKEMTVQFSIISDNGKPQQPKAVVFRDSNLQKKIMTDMKIKI